MERLDAYLKAQQLTRAEFAAQLGVTPGAVSQWFTGLLPVSPARARQIEEITGGAVTRIDLRPDLFGPLEASA